MWCRLKTVNISLFGLSCTFPDDLDLLLVGPDGTNLLFWSDAGGTHELFSQSFAMGDFGPSLPDSGGVTSGSYRPADYGSVETSSNWAGLPPGLVINHAAPNGAAAFDASFAGKWSDDTTWSLFVRDDNFVGSGSLGHWGIAVTAQIICKPHDFNGTETGSASDILWQHNDGTPEIWLMNGFTATAAGPGPNPGPSWHVKAAADFNGDGKADILWQNDDGTPAIWLMNGLTVSARARSAPIPDPPGTSRAPATSTPTARPTSSGRTTTARRRSG